MEQVSIPTAVFPPSLTQPNFFSPWCEGRRYRTRCPRPWARRVGNLHLVQAHPQPHLARHLFFFHVDPARLLLLQVKNCSLGVNLFCFCYLAPGWIIGTHVYILKSGGMGEVSDSPV